MKKIVVYNRSGDMSEFMKQYLIEAAPKTTLTGTSQAMRGKGMVLASGDTYLTMRDLGLISALKSHIKKNTQKHAEIIEFYENNKNLRVFCTIPDNIHNYEHYFNTGMIDISACYINTAYIHGIIDKKLYQKFVDLPKNKRLRLFGAMATKKTVETYENGKLVSVETLLPELIFTQTWNYIVNKTFQTLTSQIVPKIHSFQFFWVDAFYFHDRTEVEKITAEIQKIGYSSKYTPLLYSFYKIENTSEKHKKGVKKFVFLPETAEKEKYIFLPNFSEFFTSY